MKDFIKQAILTEAPIISEVLERWKDVCRPMHGAIGLCIESGELQDGFKKHVYYGKTLDRTNIKEEFGDKLWYIALVCDWLGCSIEEIQEMVIAKLRKRYTSRFSEYDALNRNLEEERRILEKKIDNYYREEMPLDGPENMVGEDDFSVGGGTGPMKMGGPEHSFQEQIDQYEKTKVQGFAPTDAILNIGPELTISLGLNLKEDEDYHLAVGIKKLLFHHTCYKELSNKLDQKSIAFVETLPPLKPGTDYIKPGQTDKT